MNRINFLGTSTKPMFNFTVKNWTTGVLHLQFKVRLLVAINSIKMSTVNLAVNLNYQQVTASWMLYMSVCVYSQSSCIRTHTHTHLFHPLIIPTSAPLHHKYAICAVIVSNDCCLLCYVHLEQRNNQSQISCMCTHAWLIKECVQINKIKKKNITWWNKIRLLGH